MREVLKDVVLTLLAIVLAILVIESCQIRMDRAVDETADAIVELMVESYKKNLTESLDRVKKQLDEEREERWRAWHEEMDAKYGVKLAEPAGGAE